ncbi:MAG TPA: hypothetical protein VGO40_00120 [Longimicrobium sp.]|jgi:hypothetical protein|nr:hypothetical protein [Longimicrobium sp.]
MPRHRIDDPRHPIQTDVTAELAQLRHEQLADALARLDPAEERSIAEEGLDDDMASWPQY